MATTLGRFAAVDALVVIAPPISALREWGMGCVNDYGSVQELSGDQDEQNMSN
ncbi:MAG: hypothetical protein KDA72_08860 [Planctomycetales bacterium]|nr:hypothetical protein [Planctomycetales bacterium]